MSGLRVSFGYSRLRHASQIKTTQRGALGRPTRSYSNSKRIQQPRDPFLSPYIAPHRSDNSQSAAGAFQQFLADVKTISADATPRLPALGTFDMESNVDDLGSLLVSSFIESYKQGEVSVKTLIKIQQSLSTFMTNLNANPSKMTCKLLEACPAMIPDTIRLYLEKGLKEELYEIKKALSSANTSLHQLLVDHFKSDKPDLAKRKDILRVFDYYFCAGTSLYDIHKLLDMAQYMDGLRKGHEGILELTTVLDYVIGATPNIIFRNDLFRQMASSFMAESTSDDDLKGIAQRFKGMSKQRKLAFIVTEIMEIEINRRPQADFSMKDRDYMAGFVRDVLLHKGHPEDQRNELANKALDLLQRSPDLFLKAVCHFAKPPTDQQMLDAIKKLDQPLKKRVEDAMSRRKIDLKPGEHPLLNIPKSALFDPLRTLTERFKQEKIDNFRLILDEFNYGVSDEFAKAAKNGTLGAYFDPMTLIRLDFPEQDLVFIKGYLQEDQRALFYFKRLVKSVEYVGRVDSRAPKKFLEAILSHQKGKFNAFRRAVSSDCFGKAFAHYPRFKERWGADVTYNADGFQFDRSKMELKDYEIRLNNEFKTMMEWTSVGGSCLDLQSGSNADMFMGYLLHQGIRPLMIYHKHPDTGKETLVARANLMALQGPRGPVIGIEKPYFSSSIVAGVRVKELFAKAGKEFAMFCGVRFVGLHHCYGDFAKMEKITELMHRYEYPFYIDAMQRISDSKKKFVVYGERNSPVYNLDGKGEVRKPEEMPLVSPPRNFFPL